MAAPTTIPGDCVIGGTLYVGSFVPSAGSVRDAGVASDAAIAASKLIHQHMRTTSQAGSAVDETRVLHNANGAGTIVGVRVSCATIPVGDATTTIDVKLNGTTILTGVVTLNSSSVLYTQQSGTLATTSYTAGQVFTSVIDAIIGTGTLPTGVSVTLIVRENPAP